MDFNYIIVQAGGKGTRMEHLTENKPKALVPVNNLPMLFHLFRKYPDKRFIIISDYKFDVMKKYLRTFADVSYLLVNAKGYKGTCAGIGQALEILPEQESFMLIWSDLILPEEFEIPEEKNNYLGLAGDFVCRWKYENGEYEEAQSAECGVAGLFVFTDKQQIIDVPKEGEFVRWLQQKGMKPETVLLNQVKEYGLVSEYNKLEKKICRPFNRLVTRQGKMIKEGIDKQGMALAVREKNWYRFVKKSEFPYIPEIFSYDPFVMEKIDGKNVFEYDFPDEQVGKKREVLYKIVEILKELHSLKSVRADKFSVHETYVTKTLSRLSKVKELIPLSGEAFITVNGRTCHNIFYNQNEVEEKVNKLLSPCKFNLIHGDCTFSNIMLRNGNSPVLIDPRGYFGYTELFGDAAYDWGKLYYSIVGNYDKFNSKDFRLTIGKEEVKLDISSNQWEDMEDAFFRLVSEEVSVEQIKLLHAIIWLSLTTYAWEDYDSICGAFYNGIFYLEEALQLIK